MNKPVIGIIRIPIIDWTIIPTVVLSPDLIQDADAQKAEGNTGYVSPKSYGSATDDVVCGDRLCETPAGEADPANEGRAQ